ncbi:hypothetical protein LJB76_00015 [Clostridia bacterium OttesenSCG-928-O13]|nr:hypothetical protein [Clostridia bacterium OttesenSCG-928-O13]
MALILGFDAGTHGVRALALDTEADAVVATARADYARITGPGIQELDPGALWAAFCSTCADLESTLPPGSRAQAMGITHQRGTVMPVDESLVPLANFFCDSDERVLPASELAALGTTAKDYYQITGCPFVSFNGMAKVLWCRENLPEVYARAAAWITPQDYVLSRLAGRLVVSAGSALRAGCYDVAHRRMAQKLFPALPVGQQPFAGIQCIEVGKAVGAVPEEDAPSALIHSAVLVAVPGDQPAALIGAGALHGGDIALNLGTTYVAGLYSEKPVWDTEGFVTCELVPGGFAPEFGTGAGGQFMDWFCSLLLGRMPANPGEWDALDALAAQAPPGAQGLQVVPLLWQPTSPGVMGRFTRLGSFHSRPHFMRAVYEGLAYEANSSVRKLELVTGGAPGAIRVFGGMSENPVFLSILATVTQKQVRVAAQKQASALGAALTAAVCMGRFANVGAASAFADKTALCYSPNEGEAAFYAEEYGKYRAGR